VFNQISQIAFENKYLYTVLILFFFQLRCDAMKYKTHYSISISIRFALDKQFYLVRNHKRSRLTYVVNMFTANIARLKVQKMSKTFTLIKEIRLCFGTGCRWGNTYTSCV